MLGFHVKMWQMEGRNKHHEDWEGRGRFCQTGVFLRLKRIPSWTWLWHFNRNSPNDTIFGRVPQKTSFYVTAGCWWFGLMKLIPLFLLPQVAQRPHESHELLAPLDTHESQHWLVPLAGTRAGAESQYCSVSVNTSFPLHLQVSPLSLQHQR